MVKISIIVPIYNVYDYLDKSLNSLLNQTYQDFEVLCINDGSTDDSQSIIDKYVKLDKRFKSYIKENGGLSDARNYGLKYVNSEYVMFIDSDDYVEKNMLEEGIKALDEGADMFIFGYNQCYFETNNHEYISLNIKDGIYNLKTNPEILAYTPNAAWNKIYKTALFKDNHIKYPFGYRHQDLGTSAKLLFLANKIAYRDIPLYNYLVDRPNNITRQIDTKLYHIIDMSKEILDFYQKYHVYDEYYDELNYLIEKNLINSLKKVVELKDLKFVYKFIDDIFNFKKVYFPKKNQKYQIYDNRAEKIYLSKYKCKLYYLYNLLKTSFKK